MTTSQARPKHSRRRRRPAPAGLLGVAASLALVACSGGTPVGFVVDQPVRLSDLLKPDCIESPITTVPTVRSLEDLAEAPRTTVHSFTFDETGPFWAKSDTDEIAVSDRDNRALWLKSFRWKGWRGALVKVEPNTHYVFERLVKTDVPLEADFAVIEEKKGKGKGMGAQRGVQVQRGRTLRVHWPEAPRPDGTWQRGSISFFTTPNTHAVEIALRTNALGRSNVGGVASNKLQVWFDEIHLERVDPTPKQAIALLKAEALAEGANPDLGMVKHGQFTPLGEPDGPHRPEHQNFSYRYALYAPPPTALKFALYMKRKATLRFSVCLSRHTLPGDSARFEIVAIQGGAETSLWSKKLTAEGSEWRWHEDVVSLTPFHEESIDLVLRTHVEKGSPHPMWGNPVVDVPPEGTEPQNVILIAVDTLRADRLSCYGYAKPTSPNLDALAADGVRFDQVASNSTWTCPSFASILTGVVPSRHTVWQWGPATPLPRSFDTVAEHFRSSGWATQAIIYKTPMYNGGFEQGFDVWFNVPVFGVKASDNLAEAMEWLEANHQRRNFLFLHFDDPHQPFNQPEPYDRKFGDPPSKHGFAQPPTPVRAGRTPDGRALMSGLYDGEVAYVDDAIGSFLEALKERGLYDNSVIGFVADHGEALWEHGYFGHSKDKLNDPVVRVPLIIKPPKGGHARGRTVKTQVRAFDVMPTLLDLAGITEVEGLDAESLLPFLDPGVDPEAAETRDRLAVIDAADTNAIAVRNQKWKYILRYMRTKPIAETLHDLQSDPGEKKNVAPSHAGVLRQMRAQALDYIMTHRPGRYLMVVGRVRAGSPSHLIEGLSSTLTIFGEKPQNPKGPAARRGALVFPGKSENALVSLTSIHAEGDVLAGRPGQPMAPRRYEPGDLKQLLIDGEPGVHLFEGPPPPAQHGTTQSEEIWQLEEMRKLGYVGGKKEDGDAGK